MQNHKAAICKQQHCVTTKSTFSLFANNVSWKRIGACWVQQLPPRRAIWFSWCDGVCVWCAQRSRRGQVQRPLHIFIEINRPASGAPRVSHPRRAHPSLHSPPPSAPTPFALSLRNWQQQLLQWIGNVRANRNPVVALCKNHTHVIIFRVCCSTKSYFMCL